MNPKEIYKKYIGKLTCAYPSDVIVKDGVAQVVAKRTQEREKYIFRGFDKPEKPVLIDCPHDVLALEFEGVREGNEEIIKAIEKRCSELNLDYCVVDHMGKSPYIYLFNLIGLPEGFEKEAKKHIAEQLVPRTAIDLLDLTNLGNTLIPVIGQPHWKPKYKGHVHEIIRGKNPLEHKNDIRALLVHFVIEEQKNREEFCDPICSQIQEKATLSELMKEYGMDISKNPTECLWHSSKGKKNFSYDDVRGVWYCFHCQEKGNIFSLVMKMEKIPFSEAKQKLMKKFNIIDTGPREDKEQEKTWAKTLTMTISSFTNFKNMAEQFYKIQPFFFDKNRLWWMWNKERCFWEKTDETDIMNKIDNVLNSDTNTIESKTRTEILEAMKRVGRQHIPREIKKTWIQIGKMIIDISTDEEFEAIPIYFVTNPIPTEIGNSEDTPIMDNLFKEWVGKNYVQTLYEIIAYSILPNYPIHRAICLNGSGCNGKGRFIALLTKFIGPDNVCSSSLEAVVSSRFETGAMYKKLLCTMGETNAGTISKTDTLKRLTGQDSVRYEFKGKDVFSDINYAKILIATNSLPATEDKTIGFYRRWMIVDFPNLFPEGKDILETIPEEEYNNLAKKSIRILKELLEKGSFTNEGTIDARRKKYETVSNPISAFIKKNCTEDADSEILYSNFREALKKFLKNKRIRKLSTRDISRLLDLEGYSRERLNREDSEGRRSTSWYVLGLKWKDNMNGVDKYV